MVCGLGVGVQRGVCRSSSSVEGRGERRPRRMRPARRSSALSLGRALCRVLLVGTSGGGSGEVRGALGDAPDDSFLRRDSALMGGSRLLLASRASDPRESLAEIPTSPADAMPDVDVATDEAPLLRWREPDFRRADSDGERDESAVVEVVLSSQAVLLRPHLLLRL